LWGRQLFAATLTFGAEVKAPVVDRPRIAKSRFPPCVIGTQRIGSTMSRRSTMAKRRRPARKTPKRSGSRRAGTPYEQAVGELFRQFFPASSINIGVWVKGPDGRRELDVDIIENVGGRSVRSVVECKDFNPDITGPVGIGYIDALDSKRRDLGLAFAFVCSNAGFTADAIRKAKRVNIGLLSATRKNDQRIRFGVVDEIYMRHIRLTEAPKLRLWPANGEELPRKEVLESGEALFEGRPIGPWFFNRFVQALYLNPIVRGAFHDYCRLKNPIRLDWPAGSATVQQIGFELALEGAWFVQTVRLESTAGLYDWLRRRMRIAPSPHPTQLQIVDINYFGGNWIAQPPDVDWSNRKLLPYECDLQFMMFKNVFPMDNPALLGPHVVPEDLNLVIKDIGASAIESVPGFTSDPVPEAEVGKKLWPHIKVVN